MKTSILPILLAASLLGGCKTNTVEVDHIPPFEPRGISTQTGDGFIRLAWLKNQELDVAGYRVYVSDRYDGTYLKIGETGAPGYSDYEATNGVTAYYAVSAVDASGNESVLSQDIVYDTPRPEGTGVFLTSFLYDSTRAGYDFSTYSIGPYNDQYTDIFFDSFGGMYYMVVWGDTKIQDMGYTTSLVEIGDAPTEGWSPTGDVRLILGHTYTVKTWDNHYAKVRIRSLSDIRVMFDWAYQLQAGNTRLKQPAARGRLVPPAGFDGRLADMTGRAKY
jgi:hypothetical protein